MKTLMNWLFGTQEARLYDQLANARVDLTEVQYLKQRLTEKETYLREKINDLQKRAILARETR